MDIEELEQEIYERAERLGYLTAKGEEGTKWMKYDPGDREQEDESPYDYAEGWTQTHQWEHECRGIISDIKEYIDSGNDDWHMLWTELRVGWCEGYSDYIKEVDDEN